MLAKYAKAQDRFWIWFDDKPNQTLGVSDKALSRYQNCDYPISEDDYIVNPFYINAVQKLGGKVHCISRWLNAISVSISDSTQLHDMNTELDFVSRITPVKRLVKRTPDLSSSAYDKKGSGTHALSEAISQLNASFLSSRSFTAKGITIAVLDDGFRSTDTMTAFQHVFDEGRVLGTHDFVDNDNDVFDISAGTHGQKVWGFMAGYMPGVYEGTAIDANYWLFRTEAGSFESLVEEDYWLAAAEMADSVGADLINSSLNYTVFDNSADDHNYSDLDGNTTIITRAADEAAKRGILVVSSAGNYGSSSWTYIGAPADADSIVAVGAIDSEGLIASFSSFGPTADGRVKPDVLALGKSAPYLNQNSEVLNGNGTSFSSPLICGLLASLWQLNPNKSAQELIVALRQTAQEADAPTHQRGFGVADFCAANQMLGEQLCHLPDVTKEWTIARAVFQKDQQEILLTINGFVNSELTIKVYTLIGQELISAKHSLSDSVGEQTIRIPFNRSRGSRMVVLSVSTINGDMKTRKVLLVQ